MHLTKNGEVVKCPTMEDPKQGRDHDQHVDFLSDYVQALEESGVPEHEQIALALMYAKQKTAEDAPEAVRPLARFYQSQIERGMPWQLLAQRLEEAYRIALRAKEIKERVRATLVHMERVFNFQRVTLRDPEGLIPEGLEKDVSELGFMSAVYSLPGEHQVTEFTGAEIDVVALHRRQAEFILRVKLYSKKGAKEVTFNLSMRKALTERGVL